MPLSPWKVTMVKVDDGGRRMEDARAKEHASFWGSGGSVGFRREEWMDLSNMAAE